MKMASGSYFPPNKIEKDDLKYLASYLTCIHLNFFWLICNMQGAVKVRQIVEPEL